MRRTASPRVAAGLVAATALAALAAHAAPAPADEPTPATLMLNWTPNNHHAGVYVALANGWYADAGLDLQVIEAAVAGADQVVGAGRADFGISQAESVIPARANGVPVVSIATILPFNDSSLMALATDHIARPRDLEGKTYGGYGGPLERELIDRLVACDGGDPDRVTFVEVGNIDYLAGLEQDRFDFVWVFEGWDALRARQIAGAAIDTIRFVDHLDCIPDWYTPVFIASEATIRDRPALVEAFLAATARGYAAAIADPEAAAAALLAAAPELDADLVHAAARYHAPLYAAPGHPWGVQEGETWRRFARFLAEAGLTDRNVDADAAFTNRLLPDAPAGGR